MPRHANHGVVIGARGIMLRALYGNLGRFQAAGAEVALVAELAKIRPAIP